ncbi:MAG: pyridoxal phosphate-dependent aminotransferase [Eubacteriales bacterium]|nr:pyridoxal phosphate-dependent aminotransferase [Eubacteriales bacterium]
MMINFDEMIERRGTGSIKYDFAVEKGLPEDVLPLWVADMDFRTPACVSEALIERAKHGIFGYSELGPEYFEAIENWFKNTTGWQVKRNWLIKMPGIVFAVATIIRALTEEGDGILIQEPVYYPFAECIETNGRKRIVNELLFDGARYTIDFEDFEDKIINNKVKLFILCNPHNPIGRVWTETELIKMGEICQKHGVLVLSDEIHQDFIYPGHKHFVFAALKPEFEEISITCTSPSKTFNLAGLQISNIFAPTQELRHRIKAELWRMGVDESNIMGQIACEAAYRGGAEWLSELKDYLLGNLAYIRDFLKEHLPQVSLVEPEGTYLVWIDFRKLGLSDENLEDLMINKARLWLDAGTMFGKGGSGFERFNIACPRATLEKAMSQLESAILALQ